jgi:hypothetical protein
LVEQQAWFARVRRAHDRHESTTPRSITEGATFRHSGRS